MADTAEGGGSAPRVVAFVNGPVGHEVVRYLASAESARLTSLVLHPAPRRQSGDEILRAAGLPDEAVLTADTLESAEGRNRLRALRPDIGVSAYFGYILDAEVLSLFSRRCINLHPSYLPYNRGAYTNVWSIVEDVPAGVSLHVMVEDVDAGPIIARSKVAVSPTDTGKSLYRKLEDACISLFCETWPEIAAGSYDTVEQEENRGSYHATRDVAEIDRIDLDRRYTARELIDRLRARTFPPHEGCYFEVDGRKVFLRLGLWWEKEYPPEEHG